ncbi:flagellin domain protein [Gemmatirosa kalamazoonensis]|jgi:flagellin|uniref:Flagellin n=1 Tax=Gemmatirosa kalamazoonensis TaxID=861299 RepID=W0R9E6_9BACT|nr:flagellin [Gemmatirosa kalamazoonensis]AHG87709.1 flagellin domain protein [Gemmatirosa kalamazoonensis]
MKIQTNTAATSALGYMKVNAQNTERSIQKLSSGFRINRAADDAAGLAIANALRADVKTLGQAQRNAAQASAMLQVADGAAQTMGNIFDRMRELASQGASATIGGQGTKLQDEWDALFSEATRIVTSTSYQGTNVLKDLVGSSSIAATAGQIGWASDSTIDGANSALDVALADGTYQLKDEVDAQGNATGKLELWSTGANAAKLATSTAALTTTGATQTAHFGAGFGDVEISSSFVAAAPASLGTAGTSTLGATNPIDASDTTFLSITTDVGVDTNGQYTVDEDANFITLYKQGSGTLDPANIVGRIDKSTLHAAATPGDELGQVAAFEDAAGNSIGITLTLGFNYDKANTDLATLQFDIAGAAAATPAAASSANGDSFISTGQKAAIAAGAPSILVGTSASQGAGAAGYLSDDSIGLDIGSLDVNAINDLMGAGNTVSSAVSLTTAAGSRDALARLDTALQTLNTFVGKLGAAESRIDYATQNVDSMLQNTQAAESSIRDADMAQEMTTFTKNNILQQAAQSMLAQANQGSQGILQLLRG